MPDIDLNLLPALDVLLAERSITKAARRLGLSPSAVSRTLARLRALTGDALLVQAGRHLVPTPYAEELGPRVHALAEDALAALRPAGTRLDLARLKRTFVIRASDGFLELLAASLVGSLTREAPEVRLRFVAKADKDVQPLRDGSIDLEVGVPGMRAPELRTQLLFRDRFVGVVRTGHPLLDGPLTAARYAASSHVVATRRAESREPAGNDMSEVEGRAVIAVPGYSDAMRIAARSDLVATVPRSCLGNALVPDHAASLGLVSFELPVQTAGFHISAIWHPRLEADPAHRWLRGILAAVCRMAYP